MDGIEPSSPAYNAITKPKRTIAGHIYRFGVSNF